MTATYLISYDLRQPGRNYQALYEAIKGEGTWCHCLDSTWFVVSLKSAAELRDKLASKLDSNDSLLVVESGSVGAWTNLSQKISDWLKENL